MSGYHVGYGMFEIYAGTLNMDNTKWIDKSECTDEAINAVRDYMVSNCLGGLDCSKTNEGGYSWQLNDGRTVKLMISIDEEGVANDK